MKETAMPSQVLNLRAKEPSRSPLETLNTPKKDLTINEILSLNTADLENHKFYANKIGSLSKQANDIKRELQIIYSIAQRHNIINDNANITDLQNGMQQVNEKNA